MPIFPVELQRKYGLTEDILKAVLLPRTQGCVDLKWSLNETPTVGFYREPHTFLKKWPISHGITNIAIGRFYICIDPELSQTSMCDRPDNVYQFIERVTFSTKPSSAPMTYGQHGVVRRLKKEVNVCSSEIQELSSKLAAQQKEICEMKREVEIARSEVSNTKHALNDVTHKLQIAQKQRDSARAKARKCEERLEVTVADSIHYEEELLGLNEQHTKLIRDLKTEISALSCSSVSILGSGHDQSVSFCFQTKDGGRVYTHAIRELYYSLLANQIPPGKIETTIKDILSCFFPSLKLDSLQLPSESCASYMRRHELTTVSLAHKAISVLEQAETGFLHLNSDGTTKFQKKIEGTALNGMVLSVNEVPDGSGVSMIKDISQELQKLRETAHALKLPNADRINWTLIYSIILFRLRLYSKAIQQAVRRGES